MEGVAREREIYRWIDGWMGRQISSFKKLILNLPEPPSAQGSCRGWETPLRNQKHAPPESLCTATACRGKTNLNRGAQNSDCQCTACFSIVG